MTLRSWRRPSATLSLTTSPRRISTSGLSAGELTSYLQTERRPISTAICERHIPTWHKLRWCHPGGLGIDTTQEQTPGELADRIATEVVGTLRVPSVWPTCSASWRVRHRACALPSNLQS